MATRRKTKVTQKPEDPSTNALPEIAEPASPGPTTTPPARLHSSSYHFPLLLSSKQTFDALLSWFSSIENDRQMPWRKKWIDPKDFADDDEGRGELATVLEERAYEVWVSEIMLQQTRVSTVIPYFNNWIAKWPTVRDLAAADRDEVFAAWKGLGYYQRASRLHKGATELVEKDIGSSKCIIPDSVEGLLGVSGVGPYTAGAISSIAFGLPEPVLDGNVIRVLSRQLGLYVDGKNKKSSDLLWKVAGRLVNHVSGFPETNKSATPGLWNQALMELGSTVCTPRPKCEECPIQKTCRVFAEGELLVKKKPEVGVVRDIEDACTICAELDTEDLVFAEQMEKTTEDTKVVKKRKQETTTKTKTTKSISNYFTSTRTTRSKVEIEISETTSEKESIGGDRKRKAREPTPNMKEIAAYCSLFPKKVIKKKIAEEECAVCLIEARTPGAPSRWLIEQRPDKGLLASLWQFPQLTLSESNNLTAKLRKSPAAEFVSELDIEPIRLRKAEHITELGSLIHVFSHLRLTMHVQLFTVEVEGNVALEREIAGPPKRRWIATDEMDQETLSTGMRKCWALVKKFGVGGRLGTS